MKTLRWRSPRGFQPNYRMRLGLIVAELDPAEGQIVIDEWAGCMAAELIVTSPLGYLQAMVSRYEQGDFILHLAEAVADIRSTPPDELSGIGEIEICVVDGDED